MKVDVEKAKKFREEHKRACILLGTTVIAVGTFLGVVTGLHGAALVVEIAGLYMVAMV